jgi:hypothetical protein
MVSGVLAQRITRRSFEQARWLWDLRRQIQVRARSPWDFEVPPVETRPVRLRDSAILRITIPRRFSSTRT